MSAHATAHLIYGPNAAGKSTYTRKLATQKQAVRFAVDDWMHTLFATDHF
jgi:predicted kinase